MSIRKKPEEAVSVLLGRLKKAKEAATEDAVDSCLVFKFNEIEKELNGMKEFYPKIKSWEKGVTDQFCTLEQGLDDDIFKDPEISHKLDLIKNDIEKLKSLISMVDISFQPNYEPATRGYDHDQTVSEEWVNLGIENKIFESKGMSRLLASFHCVESPQVKMCLLCLSIFPEKSVIKKKPIIYWWMGEGLVAKNNNQTAEEVGEQVFQQLINQGFIKPNIDPKAKWSVSSFVVYPWVRRMLIIVAEENGFLQFTTPPRRPLNCKRRAFLWQENDTYNSIVGDGEREQDLLTVFNVKVQYLGTRIDWLAKLKKAEVLQMGRWQNSATHHIEVEDQALLLNDLGSQKKLKYLSLRGISRIEALPPSIVKLVSLQILDLRACHNLEKLPKDMSALKNLTHLDISECYLLESMPKGLQHLLDLQVLKGFVLGDISCTIGDLARIKNLRKLSIRVSNQGDTGQLMSLVGLSDLRILTISWTGESSSTSSLAALPQSLRKLDLRCVPFEAVPEWLWPSRLPDLEKLYIRGGKLSSLDHTDTDREWKAVKFLRLEYLTEFEIDQRSLFPQLVDFKINLIPRTTTILNRGG
ncbi:hypothetical protein ABFS83_02G116700 [Erythranthe nasuta]